MKKNQLISKQVLLSVCLAIASIFNTVGQIYKPGDLITFDDGSQGIVFYINPDDPNSGSAAALHDLDKSYPLWNDNVPATMNIQELFTMKSPYLWITSWTYTGEAFTRMLKLSGISPAANAIDSGWYIPDLLQMRRLIIMVPELEDAFNAIGGEITNLWSNSYWTSTFSNNNPSTVIYTSNGAEYREAAGKSNFNIRPIRNFHINNDIQTYWADFPYVSDTVVSPEMTSNYDAIILFHSDTIIETSTVTVHHTARDTVWESVSSSSQPYTSLQYPIFDNLNVSMKGRYEYSKSLKSSFGCDSIVTLILNVTEDVHYYDTVCPIVADYHFAPFDTVFQQGTVSGVYAHHGSKVMDGHTIDTTAFLHLTVLPVYEVVDTVNWCLHETVETLPYPNDTRVVLTADGSSGEVSVTATFSSTSSGTNSETTTGTSSGNQPCRLRS